MAQGMARRLCGTRWRHHRKSAMALALWMALCIACVSSSSSSSSTATATGAESATASGSGTCKVNPTTALLASSSLSKVPNVANLRNCLTNNLGDFMGHLDSKKCSLATLTSLFGGGKSGGASGSGSSSGANAVVDLLNAMAGSLGMGATNGTTASSGNNLLQLAVKWKQDPSRSESFCVSMDSQVLPCVEALVPVFVQVVQKDANCCGQLRQYLESLMMVVPSQKSLTQQLFELLNGVQRTFCTKVGGGGDASSFCGQRLMSFLAGVDSTQSQLSGLFLEASVPLFAIQDDQVCDSLDAGKLKSRLASNFATSSSSSSSSSAGAGTISFFSMSCCANGFVTLLQSFDGMLQHFTGNKPEELLNLMTSLQNADEAKRFKSPYKAIQSCKFKDSCSDPKVLLQTPSSDGDDKATDTGKAKANDKQNHRPQGLACADAKVCDQGDVCSQVCEAGSVQIAPWVQRAISYQRNLSYNLPLCTTQLVATHNSYNSLARGYGNRDQVTSSSVNNSLDGSFVRTMNQYISVTDQLNLGARLVELDAHYFAGGFRTGHCSGFDFTSQASDAVVAILKRLVGEKAVTWQNSLMGCLPSFSGISASNQLLHNDSVTEVAKWVKANAKDLVVLYTEIGDEVTQSESRVEELLTMYTSAFGDLLFTPADLKSKGGKWSEFTLNDLIGAGKRVILLATPKENDIMFGMKSVCDGWVDIPSSRKGNSTGVGTFWGHKINNGVIVRAYRSVLHYGMLDESDLTGKKQEDSTDAPGFVNATSLPVFTRAGVNVLAADAMDGAKVEAMVWSWAPKEPVNGAVEAFVSAKDGRWYGSKDRKTKNKACVKSSDRTDWEITSDKCSSGYTESAPATVLENEALVRKLKASDGVDSVEIAVDMSTIPPISDKEQQAFEDKLKQTEKKNGGDGDSTSSAVFYGLDSVKLVSAGLGLTLLVLLN